MTVGLSTIAGAGQQYFDASGNVLAGGLLYSYVNGTLTAQPTYSSKSGAIANANPIVLDSSGRVPGEVWLTYGTNTTFTLTSAAGDLIGSWSNIKPLGDTNVAGPADVAFNALIGMNDLLPTAMYSLSSNPKTALPTSFNVDGSYQTGTPNADIVMVAYPRIFSKAFPAVEMAVNIPSPINFVSPLTYWRWLVYEANADGSPGNSVIDTGIFNPALNNSFTRKTISYTFLPNKIYWFAMAFNVIPTGFQYRTLNKYSQAGKFGGVYESGFVNSQGNNFFLQVPVTVTNSPASPLLTNNPPVEVGIFGNEDNTCPVFYLHTA